mmetsp:Transcript_15698/g.18118  ORF Transcript_15698/g.18118 Transcript_15698/m.18118 type:complete len:376 (-) Transcript_15698:177-1304(-)
MLELTMRLAALALFLFQAVLCFEINKFDGLNSNSDQSVRNVQAESDVEYLIKHISCEASLDDLTKDGNVLCKYIISPTEHPYSVLLFAEDCKAEPPAAVQLLDSKTDGVIDALININRQELPTGDTQQLKFCIRVDINEDFGDAYYSMNFMKSRVTINFNLDGTFQTNFEHAAMQPIDSEKDFLSFTKQYDVYARQCDPETGVEITAPLFSGDTVGVCIYASDENTMINRVNDFSMFQDSTAGILRTDPVSQGETNQLSNYDCSLLNGNMCLLISKMLLKFFDDENAAVVGIGWVDLDIRTERRRDQLLSDEDENIPAIDSRNKFSLNMNVRNRTLAVNSLDGMNTSSSKCIRHELFPYAGLISFSAFSMFLLLR